MSVVNGKVAQVAEIRKEIVMNILTTDRNWYEKKCLVCSGIRIAS